MDAASSSCILNGRALALHIHVLSTRSAKKGEDDFVFRTFVETGRKILILNFSPVLINGTVKQPASERSAAGAERIPRPSSYTGDGGW